MSDQSLVLQSVTRATGGAYTCMATNVEGKSNSNAVQLVVRCKCKVPFFQIRSSFTYSTDTATRMHSGPRFRTCTFRAFSSGKENTLLNIENTLLDFHFANMWE